MTTLYRRDGRSYQPADAADVAREVLRRRDWLVAVLERAAGHPDADCLACEGRNGSGRYVEIGAGGWIWQSCHACTEDRHPRPILHSETVADA